jgi:hypothetical protein
VYFDDLAPYDYPERLEGTASLLPGLRRVGWLSAEHAFATGPVPASFLATLERLCEAAEFISLGFHLCESCTDSELRSKPSIRWQR